MTIKELQEQEAQRRAGLPRLFFTAICSQQFFCPFICCPFIFHTFILCIPACSRLSSFMCLFSNQWSESISKFIKVLNSKWSLLASICGTWLLYHVAQSFTIALLFLGRDCQQILYVIPSVLLCLPCSEEQPSTALSGSSSPS